LEVFGRRPPVHAATHVTGRHPKIFTVVDIDRFVFSIAFALENPSLQLPQEKANRTMHAACYPGNSVVPPAAL
jgi:hypothetical protein